MAGPSTNKRSFDGPAKSKAGRPFKKQRKQKQYHSDSEEEEEQKDGGGGDSADFKAVNLLDSDNEDLDNAIVDDVPSGSGPDSDSDSLASDSAPKKKTKKSSSSKADPKTKQPELARDAPESSSEDNDDDDDDLSDDDDGHPSANRKPKSKRNDPSAFATSLSKILSTKLTTTHRADPVLARSAAAHEAVRAGVDTALAAKARRRLRDQKRAGFEKGRVRDVLVATRAPSAVVSVDPLTGELAAVVEEEGETTAQIMAAEGRLRKVAQRGVVKLFNAVRVAQVKAAEAERAARVEGVIGIGRRQERVAEMSKKGFLDLIAAGGGSLKKGPLEEA